MGHADWCETALDQKGAYTSTILLLCVSLRVSGLPLLGYLAHDQYQLVRLTTRLLIGESDNAYAYIVIKLLPGVSLQQVPTVLVCC